MATDSTNLPHGELTPDTASDMAASELDLGAAQLAQVTADAGDAVELPRGQRVVVIQVRPGQTIELPVDSAGGLVARIGPEGNLAIVIDGRTIIFQGYGLIPDDQKPRLLTSQGEEIDVADVVAATDFNLDVQTAAGPAAGGQGDTLPSSGIFTPFLAGPPLGGLDAIGVLDPTALRYRLIDDERRLFTREEDTGPGTIDITFDILGGIVNEDDLGPDKEPPQDDLFALVIKDQGNDGTGNDPFDDDNTGDPTRPNNDKAGSDDTDGVPDSDREPLVTVATVKVTFGDDIPGTLTVDESELPEKLTSEGEPIVYEVLPPSGGQGNGIVAFVDGDGDGKFNEDFDRKVFDIKVKQDSSDSEFQVVFTLYDNIDNDAPDANGDSAPDLLGADEQILKLPVKLTAEDSDGSTLSTIMNLGVEDDIPFFGAVNIEEGEEGGIIVEIEQTDADIVHDETKGVDGDADDQSKGDAGWYAFEATQKVIDADFDLPFGDSKGATKGIAQTQVMASFGADQASQEFDDKDADDPSARNSIFGELQDRATALDGIDDGENEHPFELFMIKAGSGKDAVPAEDDLDTPLVDEGNLTIADQPTGAFVTWNGDTDNPLQIMLRQVDAQTIIGYVVPLEDGGYEGDSLAAYVPDEGGNGLVAVFVLTIDDQGVMTFVQYHQINQPEAGDGTDNTHDEPFPILGEDGTPLIHVRISDYDGDHATQPVNLVIQDDGPSFKGVEYEICTGGEEPSLKGATTIDGYGASDPVQFVDGRLQLTDETGSDMQWLKVDGGALSGAIHVEFDLTMLDTGANGSADGFGLHIGNAVNTSAPAEEPQASGLSLTFDTFDNGSGDDVNQIRLWFNGGLISNVSGIGDLNEHPQPFRVELNVDGVQFTFSVKDSNGATLVNGVGSLGGTLPADSDFYFGARTGGQADVHAIDNVLISDGEGTIYQNDFNGTPCEGAIDEDALDGGIEGGPGDGIGGAVVSGQIDFKIGTDKPGTLSIDGLTITNDKGETIAFADLKTADGNGVTWDKSLPDSDGVVTWTAIEVGTGDEVFVFTLDTFGYGRGEFTFELKQALDHPFTDEDFNNDGKDSGGDPQTAWEDNLHFDFKVTATDIDGDTASGNIRINVDDDSPDGGKIEITLDNGEVSGAGLLVHDETAGVQDDGDGPNDPDFSGEDEDDVTPAPVDFAAFELAKSPATALGYAQTDINVDLSGGSLVDPDAAIGADRPGTVSAVSIVPPGGGIFDGQATNLFDTATGFRIFLWTETVGSETFVVGRVGEGLDPLLDPNSSGAIAFALHTSEGGTLELGQYRAIQHPDDSTRDESIPLLAANGQEAVISLQVTVTDADGDAVTVTQPVDGYKDHPGIVFQDDGPTIVDGEGAFSLAVDESVGGDGTDLNTPEADGVADGPAIENDEALVTLPGALTGLGAVIGAATADASGLFSYDAGADKEASHTYSLTIGGLGATGLTDTAEGQPITLEDAGIIGGLQVIEGKNTDGDIIFAVSIDPATGAVSMAQYLAIDHGDDEKAPGAHDELASLAQGALSVTLSVTDKDGDSVSRSRDISGAVTFDDDAPDVTLGEGKLTLKMDESVSLSLKDANYPEPDGIQDGSAIEGDVLANLGALLGSGLPLLPIPIGAAAGNVSGLFAVDYGSDKAGSTTYALQITDATTDLIDTETQTLITLVTNGNIVEGRDGSNNLVFAITVNPTTGAIVTAQYRAIDHGDEEPAPGAHDEVKFLTEGSLAVVATAIDKDGDSDSQSRDISPSISFDDDGPKFVKVYWGLDHDSTFPLNGTGLIDEDALPNGIVGGPGDGLGKDSTDGEIFFDFGSDKPGKLSIEALSIKDSANNVIASLSVDSGGNLIGANNLQTADGQPVIIDRTTGAGGLVTWTAYVDLGGGKFGDKVFTFALDTEGGEQGEFEFTLIKPLEHPFQDADSKNNGPEKSFEDNLNFDFTIRGTDGDGDSDTGQIKITVDDDSPDGSKVKIKFDDGKGDNALVHDETMGVQDGDDDLDDPDAGDAFQDEDDVAGPLAEFVNFEGDNSLAAIGYASTKLKVDLSGGTADADAAVGADVPGTVSAVTIVNSGGGVFNGSETNLKDTATGTKIFLFTVTDDTGETFVVGRVGNGATNPIAFALHVNDSGNLELAQYRAIQHPDDSTRDESVPLLAANNQSAIVYLQVTVTDADGDAVTVKQPVGGGEGRPGIVFQDDGPTVTECHDEQGNPVNLLINGSFEQLGAEDGGVPDRGAGSWGVFSQIPGWKSNATVGNPTGPAGLEIQADNAVGTIDAKDGENYVELDSDTLNPGDPLPSSTNASIYQDVATQDGDNYVLGFSYSPRMDNPATDGIEVWFDGVKIATIDSGKVGEWSDYTFVVKAGESDGTPDLSRLEFKAVGTADSLGGFIDDVSLTACALVDEDLLPNGIEGGPGDDGIGIGVSFAGSLGVSFGADGGKSIAFLESGQPALTSDGQPVNYDWVGNPDGTGELRAYIGGDPTDSSKWVFTVAVISLDDGGEYKFTLLKPLDHPYQDSDSANNGPETSFEDNLIFNLKFEATDRDGDTVEGHLTVNVDDDSPTIVGTTSGLVNEACLEKTDVSVSIDAADGNVDYTGATATNGVILITGFPAPGGNSPNVIKNFDNNNVPGFGVESNGDGGAGGRFDEINYTGDGTPFDTPGEAMSIKLVDAEDLASGATVVLSEFYSAEGGVELERGQYQLYRDGVAVSGWIAFVAETPLNGNPGSGLKTLNITGPSGGFDEIKFRAIVGSDDGSGGDSSDFNVKSASFDLAEIAPKSISGPINGLYGADGPGDITLLASDLPAVTVGGVPVVVTVAGDGHSAEGKIGGDTIFTLTIDPVAKTYEFTIYSPIDNNGEPDSKTLSFGYQIVDNDGDALTSAINIEVKDEGAPTIGAQQQAALVDEDGLPAGIGDKAAGDQPTDPAHNLPNESFWRGQIAFDAGCDGLKDIALSTGDIDLQTLSGANVVTAWDAATHTLTGYVAGDPANKVFTITLDPTLDGSYVLQLLQPVKHISGNDENDESFTVNVKVTDKDGDEATGSFLVNIDDDLPGKIKIDYDEGGDRIDEDRLSPFGNKDSAPGDNSGGTVVSGEIEVDFGADQPGKVEIDSLKVTDSKGLVIDLANLETADDQKITINKTVDGATGIITWAGVVADSEPDKGEAVFTFTVDGSGANIGDFKFTLHQALDHPYTDSDFKNDGPDKGFEDNLLFDFTVIATDKDGDSKTASVQINIDDDMPKLDVDAESAGTVQHDETAGVQSDSGDDDKALPIPTIFSGIAGAGTPIGWAFDGDSALDIDADIGADRPGVLSTPVLALPAGNVDSGLDTTAGNSIWLFLEGGLVVGRVGSGTNGNTPSAGGAVAFAVAMDGDGKLSVVQYLSLKHPTGGSSHDEDIGITSNKLLASVTLTDADGDAVTETASIGHLVRFDDDGPVAVADEDNAKEDDPAAAIGNVLTGANITAFGSDVNVTDGVADDAGSDGLKSIQWKEGGGFDGNGQIQGLYGTLFVNSSGEYKYVVDNTKDAFKDLDDSEQVTDTFTYVITDKDGDTSTTTLKITIDGKDDVTKPTVNTQTALVDEDGLAAGAKDSASGDLDADVAPDQLTPDESKWRSNFTIDWGGDQGTIALTAGDWSGLKAISGNAIVAVAVAGGGLAGYDSADAPGGIPNGGAVPVFTISAIDPVTGVYTVTLNKALLHPDSNNNAADDATDDGKGSYEDNLLIPVNVMLTNSAGSTPTTLTINVDDDSPNADLINIDVDENGGGELVHDETAGAQDGDDDLDDPDAGDDFEDEDDVATRPVAFKDFEDTDHTGLTNIGYASVEVDVSLTDGVNPNAAFGADGPGSVDLSLTQADGSDFDGQLTNLRDTKTTEFIFLFTEGDIVVGRYGTDAVDAETGGDERIVFALSLADDGSLDLAQYRAIAHPNTGTRDESVTLLGFNPEEDETFSLVFATAKVTDADGDSVTKSVPLDGEEANPAIRFQDDGPTLTVSLTDGSGANGLIVELDETVGDDRYTPSDTPDGGPADDVFGALAQTKTTVSGGLEALFTVGGGFGADGPGGDDKTSLAFVGVPDGGLPTNLKATDGGAVTLYREGVDNTIIVGKDGDGDVVFRMEIVDAGGGKHQIQTTLYEALIHGEDDKFDESVNLALSQGVPVQLQYEVTRIDGDGDSVTQSAKIDLVTGEGSVFTFDDDGPAANNDGNVGGVNETETGWVEVGLVSSLLLGNDKFGSDGPAAANSIVITDDTGDNGGKVKIENGKLYYDPESVSADTEETFSYKITDGDGDSSTATFKLTTKNVVDKPSFENANTLVDEDGLPLGFLNDPVGPTDDPAPGDDVGGNQVLGQPSPASEAISRDSLNINWNQEVGTIAFSVTDANLAAIRPLNGAVLTTANVSDNGTADLKLWDGTPGTSNLILELKVIDAATSVYEVQLFQPIKHTAPGTEDNKSLPVTVTATNGGGSSEQVLTVSIDDDSAAANDDDVDLEPAVSGTADIVFIVDVSGSMTGSGSAVPDVPGFADNRLGLARYSMQQLLLNHPEILNVQFIKFDDDVDSPSSVWLSRADALAYILVDANFVGGGNTNYDLALGEAMNVYDNSVRPVAGADQTLVYFLSDGAPNDGGGIQDGPIDSSNDPGVITRQEWEAFVTDPANDITNVFAIGLGDGVNVGNLEPIAYPNDDTNPADGTEDHVVVIATANLTDLTQTLDDLLGSVLPPVPGDALANDDPGADGYGTPELVSVFYNATTYTFGPATQFTIDLGVGRGSLKINDDGTYVYTPPSGGTVDGTPFFVEYTIRDGDGDTSTAKLHIDLNSPPTTDLNGGLTGDDVTIGFTEQTPVLIAPAATIADDDGTLASMTVTLTNRPNGNAVESLSLNGAATAAAAGLTVLYTAATGVLSITGSATAATYQTILNGILYNNTSDAPNTTPRSVTVAVNDGVNDSLVNTSTINVTPVNDAPDAVAPAGPYSATEQVNLALHGTGLSISDVDAGGGSMTVTLSVGFGILTLTAGNSGATIGAGNGTSSVQVTGTVTQINNLLGGIDTGAGSAGTINYNANADTPPASTTLTLAVNDNGNTGGGNLTDSANVTINITDAAEPPVAVDDKIYTNISSLITVKDGWLLKNDTDADTANASLVIASAVAAASQSGFFDTQPSHAGTNVTFEIDVDGSSSLDDGESTSFDYVVKDPVLQDTGNVLVTYDASGSVNGSGNDDILIGLDVGLNGGAGNDQIVGTGTKDLLDFSGVSSDWSLTLGAGGSGTATIDGTDSYEGIDGIIGGSGKNTLTGNDGNNILSGGGGNDNLTGGLGTDTLNGDGGDDILNYDNQDTFNGGANFDTLLVGGAGTIVTYGTAFVDSVEMINLGNSDHNQGRQLTSVSIDDILTEDNNNTTGLTNGGQTIDLLIVGDNATGTVDSVQLDNAGSGSWALFANNVALGSFGTFDLYRNTANSGNGDALVAIEDGLTVTVV